MSVFEELIDELKDEDLLEETVFSLRKSASATSGTDALPAASTSEEASNVPEAPQEEEEDFVGGPVDERESYRRRAMEEVSSLQMVEHVLSGIEREHMKMSPQAFDDLGVKKALHKYLQVSGPVHSQEHAEAEFQLFQETEKWYSTLCSRDNDISVANVRRFCENSRPVLSSQALISLARFYRNSPYNEAVRGKFDFVMTKLFSREVGDEKRKLLFGRHEMVGHVKTLYANWASLSISASEDVEPDYSVSESISGFESFFREAESAESFDALISADFFNRVRLFKEDAAETFYEPAVIAAGMESNVRIGNRFVDLIHKEHALVGEEAIEEKYGYTYDTIISGAASKTLLLLDVLREAKNADEIDSEIVEPTEQKFVPPRTMEFERAPVAESRGLFAINKWLILATIMIIALSGGVYFWSENATSANVGIEVAPSINIAGTELTKHIREASSSNETLYGVLQPTWDAMSADDQRDFLSKTFEFAKARGMKKVNLLNSRGRTVGFAGSDRMELFGPQ